MLFRKRNRIQKGSNHLDRNYLRYATAISVLIPIALFAADMWYPVSDIILEILSNKRSSIYGTTASIAGSLLGFIITAISIIIAFSASNPLKKLSDNPYYKQIYYSYIATIRALALLTVIVILGLVFESESSPNLTLVYFIIGAMSLSVLTLIRSIWILENFITIAITGNNSRESIQKELPEIPKEDFDNE